jgi:hypothetical protein
LHICNFQQGKSISQGLPFCIFVRSKIYVLEIEILEPVFMAR